MIKAIKNNLIWCFMILIVALAAGAYSFYKTQSTKLLDKNIYKEFLTESEVYTENGFSDQEELRSFIETWADNHDLEYKNDGSGNIIFDKAAVKRKQNVTPTLVLASMNYETAPGNIRLLAAALSIAYSDIDSGRKTVILVNDEKNKGTAYKKLSSKYLASNSKVVYLDYGSSAYLSTASFGEVFSEITVPAEREENVCDTMVRISITGIDSGSIGPAITKQPDPIMAFSNLLTRLKSKSVICRLANVEVGSNGNMYPTSITADITLNSYSVNSFTSYIDKRIKAWEKAYGDDFENLEYTYEVIDDPDELPEYTYNEEVFNNLAGVLYTIKTGTYRYDDGDAIPDGKEAGDTYGINCVLGMDASDDSIVIKLCTQGYDDSFIGRILSDNSAASKLYECKYNKTSEIKGFSNTKDKLSLTFMKTYLKVNDTTSAESGLSEDSDNFFTPCSYLQEKNSKADIIHIRLNSKSTVKIANTLLCYIKTKGNTTFF